MREPPPLLGSLFASLLVALLTLTSPLGTGSGKHRFQLLHPIFPHGHAVVIHATGTSDYATRPPDVTPGAKHGTELTTGTGITGVNAGQGLTPPLPDLLAAPTGPPRAGRLARTDWRLPDGLTVAPPDPPPPTWG